MPSLAPLFSLTPLEYKAFPLQTFLANITPPNINPSKGYNFYFISLLIIIFLILASANYLVLAILNTIILITNANPNSKFITIFI